MVCLCVCEHICILSEKFVDEGPALCQGVRLGSDISLKKKENESFTT